MNTATYEYDHYNERYYHTTGMFLAAHLTLKGMPLVRVESNSRTTVYSFKDAPERTEWVSAFEEGRAIVNARHYALSLRDIIRLTQRSKSNVSPIIEI